MHFLFRLMSTPMFQMLVQVYSHSKMCRSKVQYPSTVGLHITSISAVEFGFSLHLNSDMSVIDRHLVLGCASTHSFLLCLITCVA
uniref:Uncharacterized protein n=1 Tax=Physcomitrium patens TaxID=3218 RepID=A0A2K1JLT1_PHYPA|nr:hypothetical protein PHYPA_017330 [Physcomitrium patens]